MRKYKLISLLTIFLVVTLFTIPAFSQQNSTPPASQDNNIAPASTNEQAPPAKAETPQPKDISIYGEVQSVDASTSSLKVQYYDYDNDEEKTMEITTNKDTKIDNASSLTDIKKGDWADITYMVSEAKNIAKSISVEKEEGSAAAPADTSNDTE